MDYFHVDPLLGGDEAFDELLEQAHARGIRIVLDGVFNHASRGFLPFNDIAENHEHSPWIDWFKIESTPLNPYAENEPPQYEAWWNLHALPKLNTDHPDVREFLMTVAEHWIRKGRRRLASRCSPGGHDARLLGGVPDQGQGGEP